MSTSFDWDDGNCAKCRRHGVSLAEIEDLFRAGASAAPDTRHSAQERRLIAVGRTKEGRALFVAFTLRTIDGQERIRPISARYMHEREFRRYDQARSGI
jgi:uncharacterized DUF497 family protein